MLGHHWPASKTPFLWYFDPWSLSPHQLKRCHSWSPSDKTFWICAWFIFCTMVAYEIYSTKKKRATKHCSTLRKITSDRPVYQCKGISFTVASHVFLQSCVEIVLKKIGHEQSGCKIVKTQEISVFIMLSCWISSSNWNHFSRPNCT